VRRTVMRVVYRLAGHERSTVVGGGQCGQWELAADPKRRATRYIQSQRAGVHLHQGLWIWPGTGIEGRRGSEGGPSFLAALAGHCAPVPSPSWDDAATEPEGWRRCRHLIPIAVPRPCLDGSRRRLAGAWAVRNVMGLTVDQEVGTGAHLLLRAMAACGGGGGYPGPDAWCGTMAARSPLGSEE
jgi:hypothetical protein